MGAGAVSNSYGGAESETFGPPERALFEHPGVVIAAATGDDGYDSWTTFPDPETTNAPASMPGVISVGGTTLSLNGEGKRAQETVWNGNGRENEREYESGASGGGCSIFFEAPFWQRYAPGFAASGCGDKRLNADVAAVADPVTGFDIYDTYDCGPECEELKANGTESWSTIGGTSVSTPLIASLYALAGGADGITYPAETLYAHLGDASLFDVENNGNGYCNNGGGACGINAQFHEELDCEGTTRLQRGAGLRRALGRRRAGVAGSVRTAARRGKRLEAQGRRSGGSRSPGTGGTGTPTARRRRTHPPRRRRTRPQTRRRSSSQTGRRSRQG